MKYERLPYEPSTSLPILPFWKKNSLLQSFSFTCTISLYFIPLQKYEFNLNTPNISTVFSSNLNKIIPFFQFFRNTDGWQGWQTPPQKKLKTRVTSVTQQTGSNKGRNRKRWQVTLLYTLFFMTYRAKIDKRLIIRGRHPNWRVVSPMHKKKMKSRCHRHPWDFFVKLYAFQEQAIWRKEMTCLRWGNDLISSPKWLDYRS